jgi:hypothetical protein
MIKKKGKSNYETKNLKISAKTHQLLKNYCLKNDYFISKYVEGLIEYDIYVHEMSSHPKVVEFNERLNQFLDRAQNDSSFDFKNNEEYLSYQKEQKEFYDNFDEEFNNLYK